MGRRCPTCGYTPASIVVDRPVVIESEGFVWRPENYGRRFLGPLILSEALARSVNNAAIHLLQEVGIDEVLAFARRLGIGSPMERNLGLALGSNPLTLLELTRAYGAFASGGKVVGPRILLRVLDRDGRVVLGDARLGEPPRPPDEGGHPPGAGLGAGAVAEEPVRSATLEKGEAVRSSGEEEDALAQGYALTPQEAYLTTSLLRQVIEHPKGTGRRARVLGRPLAGKTGTTNDQGDAWFVGYSPEVVTGVWVGFDEKRVLGRGETGGRAALPIWIDAMRAALADRPVRDFPVPEGIVFARIDARTGLLASPQSKRTLFQPFLAGTEPQEEAGLDLNGSRDEQRLRLGF